MLPTFLTSSPAGVAILDAGGVSFLLEQLQDGKTYRDIGKQLGFSRTAITNWVASQPPAIRDQIAQADKDGASAWVDETVQIADDLATEVRTFRKPMYSRSGELLAELHPVGEIIAADKERIAVRQWAAERKDRERWGGRSAAEVTVNLNTVYLDVLRKVNSQPPPSLQEIPAPPQPPREETLDELLG